MSWLGFILIGLVAGALARLLYPGRQPMGIIATMALGIVGSLLGGLISYLLGYSMDDMFHPAGLIMSTVGALIVLFLFVGLSRRRYL